MPPASHAVSPVEADINSRLLVAQIAYNAHGGYCVPLSSKHRPVAHAILTGNVWEPDTIAIITSNSLAGDIVHAGAYFGDFIPPLARACEPDRYLWAFEPNIENYRCSQITVALNGIANVHLSNHGLGPGHGEELLRFADDDGNALGGKSHVVAQPWENDSRVTLVSIVAVDDVLPPDRPISVIHLDVEGYEGMALRGAMRTVQRWRPLIILETLPERAWMEDNLISLGYGVSGRVHRNWVLSVTGSHLHWPSSLKPVTK